jgi:hypothetical protein
MKSGFMNFSFKDGVDKGAPVYDIVTDELLQEYQARLVLLICEILDRNVAFAEIL